MNTKVVYDVFHPVYWDVNIALALFFGGIGVGAYLFAVFISYYYKDKYKEVSRVGAFIEPICILLAIFFLIVDLDKPFRAYKFYTNGFAFGSPLSWGAWLQGTFFMITILYAYSWYKDNVRVRKIIGYIGVPFAFTVGGYYGYLLSIVKAKPLWFGAPSIITAILGFAVTGIAAVVLVLSLRKDTQKILSSIRLSRNILGVLIIGQIFAFYLWIISLYYGPFGTKNLITRFNSEFAGLFWGGVVFFGLLLPLAIGIISIYKEHKLPEQERKMKIAIPILTSILVLTGGILFRYVWVIGGQMF